MTFSAFGVEIVVVEDGFGLEEGQSCHKSASFRRGFQKTKTITNFEKKNNPFFSKKNKYKYKTKKKKKLFVYYI